MLAHRKKVGRKKRVEEEEEEDGGGGGGERGGGGGFERRSGQEGGDAEVVWRRHAGGNTLDYPSDRMYEWTACGSPRLASALYRDYICKTIRLNHFLNKRILYPLRAGGRPAPGQILPAAAAALLEPSELRGERERKRESPSLDDPLVYR